MRGVGLIFTSERTACGEGAAATHGCFVLDSVHCCICQMADALVQFFSAGRASSPGSGVGASFSLSPFLEESTRLDRRFWTC